MLAISTATSPFFSYLLSVVENKDTEREKNVLPLGHLWGLGETEKAVN